MKKKNNITALAYIIFSVSCHNSNNKIATIKNNTSNAIICELLNNAIMTDSLLYNDKLYMRYLIQPQHYDTYTLPDSDLTKAPDAEKTYIYILKLDSLHKFLKLKHTNGILKHSLLKKIVVQLNKVKEPLDTIYAR